MDRGKGGDKPELKDLVTGQCEGRTTSNQITFYRNVGNQGLQFSSVGGLVYEKIIERNMGRDIPTDWLLQDIRD
jgi:alanine dehydrogenase